MTIKGNWYAPVEHLKNLKSTVKADIIQMSSSAGDWDGYLIKKVGNKYQLKFWSQENKWPRDGFELYIDKPFATLGYEPTENEIYAIYATAY